MAAKKKKTKSKARPSNGIDARTNNVKTLVALAIALGVGRNTPSRWKSYPDFPMNRDGTYPVAKIAAWVDAMRSRQADRQVSGENGRHRSKERADAELDYRKAKLERERIAIEKDRGELLSRDDIEARSAELLADLRRNLLVILPRRIAPKDPKLQAAIKAEVRLFLEAMST